VHEACLPERGVSGPPPRDIEDTAKTETKEEKGRRVAFLSFIVSAKVLPAAALTACAMSPLSPPSRGRRREKGMRKKGKSKKNSSSSSPYLDFGY